MRLILRRAIDTLRGGVHPRDVALAIALGLVAGLVTGWNLTLPLVLVCVALLNVHARAFALAWGIGWGLSYLLEDITYRTGLLLLDSTPLGGLVASLGDDPIVAMLDWDRYAVVGGAALGLLTAIPAARIAAKATRALSRQMPDDPACGWRGRHGGLPLGLALVCLYGGSQASRSRRSEQRRLLRPKGFLLALLVAGASSLLPWWLGPVLIKHEMLARISAANGAEATAGDFKLSLRTGQMVFDDLQLADPRHLDRDRLRVGRLTVQLRPGPLVRGRLHVDHLLAEHVRSDVARTRAATLARRQLPPLDVSPAAVHLATPQELELDGYLQGWDAMRDRVAWFGQLISFVEALSAWEDTSVPRDAAASPHTASLTSTAHPRSDLGNPQPRVWVSKLRAEDLPRGWGLGRRAHVELAQLSSRPVLSGRPATLEIAAPAMAAELSADFNLHQPGQKHTVRVKVFDVRLPEIIDPNQTDRTLILAAGTADLQGEGWMDVERLELNVRVESKQLDLRVVGHDKLAGLEPSLWEDGLRRLGELRAEVVLAGHWSAPNLTVDTTRLVEHFKHQLRAAGAHQLVRDIDDQLAHPAIETSLAKTTPSEPVADAAAGFYLVSDTGELDNSAQNPRLDRPADSKTQLHQAQQPRPNDWLHNAEADWLTGKQQPPEPGAADEDVASAPELPPARYPATKTPQEDFSLKWFHMPSLPPATVPPELDPFTEPEGPRVEYQHHLSRDASKVSVAEPAATTLRRPPAFPAYEPETEESDPPGFWTRWSRAARGKVAGIFPKRQAKRAPSDPFADRVGSLEDNPARAEMTLQPPRAEQTDGVRHTSFGVQEQPVLDGPASKRPDTGAADSQIRPSNEPLTDDSPPDASERPRLSWYERLRSIGRPK